MTPTEAIEHFWGQISWKDECTVKGGMIFANCSVLVPCHYTELDARLPEIIILGQEAGLYPGVILHGDEKDSEVSPAEIERCWWALSQVEVCHYWLGAHNRLQDGRLTLRAMDGVDIGRFLTDSISGRGGDG